RAHMLEQQDLVAECCLDTLSLAGIQLGPLRVVVCDEDRPVQRRHLPNMDGQDLLLRRRSGYLSLLRRSWTRPWSHRCISALVPPHSSPHSPVSLVPLVSLVSRLSLRVFAHLTQSTSWWRHAGGIRLR